MPDYGIFSGYFVAHPPPFTAMIHTPERVVISRVGGGGFSLSFKSFLKPTDNNLLSIHSVLGLGDKMSK